MRPYMLWLAMTYGLCNYAECWRGGDRDTALEDWIKYQSEQRFLVDAGRR